MIVASIHCFLIFCRSGVGSSRFHRKVDNLPDGRICVEARVQDGGVFKGVGRNLRIAKCTASKYALRALEGMPIS